jgi:protocatechuate 3,4-dioxygenase beta subunit
LSPENRSKEISRRQAIGIMAVAGAGVMLGCGGGKLTASTTSTSTSTGSATTATGNAACILTPELTVGPYFVDEKLNRSDLTTDTFDTNVTNGVPLTLQIFLMDYSSSGCSALSGAQVDVWHADAAGVYSDESVEATVGQTYLRGYQTTDSNGLVTFKTIFSGWYSGRTVHIHVMIRTFSSSGTQTFEFTTQLFFDPALTLTIMAKAPYNTRGNPDTTNATDNIYNSETLLSLTSATSGSGYTTSITIGVQT